MRVVALIPARMDSTRLPGKVLIPLLGQSSTLTVLVSRLRQSHHINDIEVLTTNRSIDEPIRKWAASENVRCRSSKLPVDDVLGRFQESADLNGADIVVRANGDCPFLDPHCIDSAIEYLIEQELECVTGKAEYTGLPPGLLGDVLTSSCLFRLSRQYPLNREHVTAEVFTGSNFDWQGLPLHRVKPSLAALSGLNLSFTLDTASDLEYLPSVAHLVDPEIA